MSKEIQRLILSPKDNLGKITLDGVASFALEGETLLVVFDDGRTRNYPLQHIWYYESHTAYHQRGPLVEKTKQPEYGARSVPLHLFARRGHEPSLNGEAVPLMVHCSQCGSYEPIGQSTIDALQAIDNARGEDE